MVTWADPAKADLKSLHDFIAHDSTHYAKKVSQDMVAKSDILDELPRLGRMVPEFEDPNVRELSIYSYRIIYEIKNEHIFVIAVIHKRQNLKPEMIRR